MCSNSKILNIVRFTVYLVYTQIEKDSRLLHHNPEADNYLAGADYVKAGIPFILLCLVYSR